MTTASHLHELIVQHCAGVVTGCLEECFKPLARTIVYAVRLQPHHQLSWVQNCITLRRACIMERDCSKEMLVHHEVQVYTHPQDV